MKEYLKDTYPKSKCDMCNAFIELSYKLLEEGGIAGLVTQNSWMYLDSFEELRRTLLSDCSIDQIWELGSNAFYDLSGEKSNVALLLYRKTRPKNGSAVRLISLKTMELTAKESLLSSKKDDINFEKTIL
ncbi:MAG: Eco57I restriction-modification methylase domain-containing protein, partial [Hydrogeniiclostridium mannosilyticum]